VIHKLKAGAVIAVTAAIGEYVSKNMSSINATKRTLSGEPLIASADGEPAMRYFTTKHMDAAWIERLQTRHPHLWQDPKRLELRRNLLRFGGSEVNLSPPEPYLDILVSERARVWDGATSKRIRGGEPNSCHSNVARHYERQRRPRWRIATGYALCDKGLWRQHSWLCGHKSIGETTVRFVAYAGVMLDDVEVVLFWLANRRESWPFPEPPPPALRLDDPGIAERVLRALPKRIEERASLMRPSSSSKTEVH
jgi:hypothetical protein